MRLVSYNQPSSAPTPKVAAVGVAGAGTVLLVYIVKTVFNLDIPAEVASAVTVLLGFGAGYFTKDVKPVEAVEVITKQGA